MPALPSEELIAVFDPTIRGFSADAPPRSLRPEAGGPIWRASNNLIPREGRLRPRPKLATMGGLGDPLQPDFFLTPGTNKEIPVFTHSATTTGPVDTFNRATLAVVVTNRQIYIYNGNVPGWFNATPTYTAGTIQVQGSPPSATILGTGTLWSTRKISAGQHILIGSTWYQIASVNSDVSITLTGNYVGANAAGLSYTIRRTWAGSSANDYLEPSGMVHCTIFNDDLYVAGTYLGSADGATVLPAVIKVTGINDAAPTTEYLTSSELLTAGLDIISDLTEITGIQCLQDGRVVFSGNMSTVFYSDLLDVTRWTTSPAGRTIVVGRLGGINALGKLGNNLTLHYDTGITLAYPTGQIDPPLSFQGTTAPSGCISPLTLKCFNGVEMYAGVGGMVFAFDGNASHPIGGEVTEILAQDTDVNQRHMLAGYINARWGEYGVFFAAADRSNMCVYVIENGSWWVCRTPVPIGAIADEDHLSAVSILRRHSLVGIVTRDGSTGAGETTSNKAMLWGYDVDGPLDDVTFTTSGGGYSTGGVSATTDDLDFGFPTTEKSILRVLALFTAQSVTTENVSVEYSRDGGATWLGPVMKSITYSVTDETLVQFSIDSPASIAWRIRVNCGTIGVLTYLKVIALPAGEAEEVRTL